MHIIVFSSDRDTHPNRTPRKLVHDAKILGTAAPTDMYRNVW